jgi:hypothetical protein
MHIYKAASPRTAPISVKGKARIGKECSRTPRDDGFGAAPVEVEAGPVAVEVALVQETLVGIVKLLLRVKSAH